MKLYRVEASFSTLDQMGRLESVNLGPYMAMPQVIEAVNDTHAHNDSDLWINENEIIGDSFYSISDTHPKPDDEQSEKFWKSSTFVCGFTSLEKLRAWFCNKDLRVLKTTHFMIAIYEFDGRRKKSIQSNEFQDVFDLHYCKMKSFIDIEDLLNA